VGEGQGCVCRMLVSSKNCRDSDFSPFSSLLEEWRLPVKSLAPGSCINYRSARWTSIQLDAIQLYTLFQCLHRHAAPEFTYSQTITCKQTLMDSTDTTFLRIAWIQANLLQDLARCITVSSFNLIGHWWWYLVLLDWKIVHPKMKKSVIDCPNKNDWLLWNT